MIASFSVTRRALHNIIVPAAGRDPSAKEEERYTPEDMQRMMSTAAAAVGRVGEDSDDDEPSLSDVD